MPHLTTILLFAAAAMALLLTPGPAVVYIVTRSMAQGRAAGLVSVLGVHVGTIGYVIATSAGLSALLPGGLAGRLRRTPRTRRRIDRSSGIIYLLLGAFAATIREA